MVDNLFIFSSNYLVMKKFLLKLSFVFMLIFLADFIFGFVADQLYCYVPSKQSYALTKCNEDIIILGSSRAEGGIMPTIITDSTNMSCYNLAVGGQNIYYDYGILNTILTHHTPKMVLLDITAIDYLDTPKWNTEKVGALNPLYNHVDSIKMLVNSIDYFNKFRLLSNTYQFNSTLFTLVSANIIERKYKNEVIKGNVPINKIYDKEISPPKPTKIKIDDNKLVYLKKIENICYKKNIKLVLLLSPQFFLLDNSYGNMDEFQKIISGNGYNIWDYSQDTTFIRYKNLFADPAHLNIYGAKKYSKILAHRIKEINL